MKLYYIIMLAVLAAVLAPFIARAVQSIQTKGLFTAINIAGTHAGGCMTRTAEGALASRHLLVKAGTDPAKQVIVCGATDEPVGIADDAAADAELVAVGGLSANDGTRLAVASEAIAAEARVYTDAGGKVTDTSVTGCYLVGRAKTAAAADGDEIEIETCFPVVQS